MWSVSSLTAAAGGGNWHHSCESPGKLGTLLELEGCGLPAPLEVCLLQSVSSQLHFAQHLHASPELLASLWGGVVTLSVSSPASWQFTIAFPTLGIPSLMAFHDAPAHMA